MLFLSSHDTTTNLHNNNKLIYTTTTKCLIDNVWANKTKVCNINDAGEAFIKRVGDESQGILEEWSGEPLWPGEMNGIRIYSEGALLVPHIDVTPNIISAIVVVDQDDAASTTTFPLEVYSHDGVAHNITTRAGDMILYESATVIHGRPFPLKGSSYMANAFLHFQPLDRLWRTRDLPKARWLEDLHHAARTGDLELLEKRTFEQKNDQSFLHHRGGVSGRTLLHDSAHAGHAHIVKYLHEAGADLNIKSWGDGATSMHLAKVEGNHDVVSYLESWGAVAIGPEL